MIPSPDILTEIARTQAERRKNWPTVYEPADPDLERAHIAKLNALKNALNSQNPRTICTRRPKNKAPANGDSEPQAAKR